MKNLLRIAVMTLSALSSFIVIDLRAEGPPTAQTISEAIQGGKIGFNFRYRYEGVDQDGIDEDAGASTLRSRLTYTSATLNNFHVGVEADYVSVIGGEQYNSTENGRTRFPVVADPEGFDLNQAYLSYESGRVKATGGRQRIVHADQRFVGGVAWRQNEQTYDAARIEFGLTPDLKLDYAYVWNVNRIFGPDDGAQPADWDGNTHILNLIWQPADNHKLSGFAYLLDFEDDNGPPNSTRTYGVSYAGTFDPIKVNARVARQSDYEDNPLNYEATYIGVAVSAKVSELNLIAGYEVLGSDDGVAAFRTPLATLHAFQGWADKFLGTPADGLEDVYGGVSGEFNDIGWAVRYHDFSADEGSASYGTEINAVANVPISDAVSLQLKFASYDADELATDTTKYWLTLTAKI